MSLLLSAGHNSLPQPSERKGGKVPSAESHRKQTVGRHFTLIFKSLVLLSTASKQQGAEAEDLNGSEPFKFLLSAPHHFSGEQKAGL